MSSLTEGSFLSNRKVIKASTKRPNSPPPTPTIKKEVIQMPTKHGKCKQGSVNSILKDETGEKEVLMYPRLMECKSLESREIVLFERKCVGTCVWSEGNYANPVGYWCESWNMDVFKPFEGAVELNTDMKL